MNIKDMRMGSGTTERAWLPFTEFARKCFELLLYFKFRYFGSEIYQSGFSFRMLFFNLQQEFRRFKRFERDIDNCKFC